MFRRDSLYWALCGTISGTTCNNGQSYYSATRFPSRHGGGDYDAELTFRQSARGEDLEEAMLIILLNGYMVYVSCDGRARAW